MKSGIASYQSPHFPHLKQESYLVLAILKPPLGEGEAVLPLFKLGIFCRGEEALNYQVTCPIPTYPRYM